MCDGGATIAIIGAVVAAAGSAASIAASQASAKRQEKVAKYQAAEVRRASEIELERHRRHVLDVLGKQRAQGAGQGFIINAGSNLDIQSDTLEFGEFDSLVLKANAEREAWAIRAGGREAKMATSYQSYGAGLDAAGGLLTGVGKYQEARLNG